MSITLSAGVRANVLALRRTADEMSQAQQRLATGLRVNSAMDNPAAFFTASSLSAKAATLTVVNESISNAKNTLDAASAGIEAVQSLIANARNLLNSASASTSTAVTVTGSVAGLSGATTLSNYEAGDTITVNDGTTTATYTYADGDTVQHFIDAVNATVGLEVSASLSSDGHLQLNATSTNDITIGGSASTSEKADIGLVAATTTFTTNTLRQSLAQQFDSIRSQIDSAARDAGYNGTNLLAGSTLSVNFNESGSSTLTVAGSSVTADDLGIDAASSGSGESLQLDSEISSLRASLDAASATLEAQAATYQSEMAIASTRESFTNSMIGIMQTGADDLQLADTDEDSALLLALQARQKLASTTLSMAAQDSLPALRLMGWT